METCWTVIRDAARGDRAARSLFARRYESAVRAYLASRWTSAALRQEVDDAVQEVFMECFKERGALERAESSDGGAFRPFLYGLVRNVARRWEERRARELRRHPPGGPSRLDALEADETSLARVFDRAWARAVMRQAGERLRAQADRAGGAALRRVELLRLRFEEGLAIREIAESWQEDAARLHHEYAKARREFRAALREVVAFHLPGRPDGVDRECSQLLELLA